MGGRPPRLDLGSCSRGNDVAFLSTATFEADQSGRINTAAMAPKAGFYRSVAPSGLLWSMKAPSGTGFAHSLSWSDRVVRIEARIDDGEVLNAEITRTYSWSSIPSKEIELDGAIGQLWVPESDRDLPLIIVLGGYDAGAQYAKSSLLAARGFAVLDLTYHGRSPLPRSLERIPLEYTADAIAWAKSQPGVDGSKVGVFGTSKGAEYALVLASKYSDIKAVAGWTPSSVVWAGIGGASPFPKSSWTYNGRDVPYIPAKLTPGAIWRGIQFAMGRPVAFHDSYLDGLKNKKHVARATIEVEKIAGPILLVSGSDDKMWPAKKMSEMIVDRLEAKNFQHQVTHLNYDNVGHTFPWGQWPTGDLDSGGFIRGGEIEASHIASAEAWHSTIEFFKSALVNDDNAPHQ